MNDQTTTPDDDEAEINVLELVAALGEHKRLLFGIPVLTTAIALVYALTATPIYTATAVILPPQQQTTTNAMLASLGSLAALAGGGDAGGPNSSTIYVAFMNSHSVEDEVIQKLDLQQRYHTRLLADARRRLEGSVNVTSSKATGLITIAAADTDPVFAAKLANTEVDALHDLLGRLAITNAQQRRVFFEQQIALTEKALAAADAKFRQLSAQGGLSVTETLATVSVSTSAELRAQIAAKEVELASARQFATERNPDLQRLSSELAAMHAQLDKIEGGGAQVAKTSPAGEAAIAALRDLKTQQAVLDVMIQQYEMAKIDEAREGPTLQKVDIATPPEYRSTPKRGPIVIFGAIAGLVLGFVAAFARYAWQKAEADPETGAKLTALKKAWKLW
jgi:uncharacterized protein involved in exopolysaccharide biosynthesis